MKCLTNFTTNKKDWTKNIKKFAEDTYFQNFY